MAGMNDVMSHTSHRRASIVSPRQRMVHVGASRDEKFNNCAVRVCTPIPRCRSEGSVPAPHHYAVHISSCKDELRCDAEPSFLRSKQQRRYAVAHAGKVHVRARCNEMLHHGIMSSRSTEEQRRRPGVIFGEIHVCTRRDERRDDLVMTIARGGKQRSRTV